MEQANTYHSMKHEFISKLDKYIKHKNVLANNSPWYKAITIANAISKCNMAFTNIIKNCGGYSLQRICQLVLINKNTLSLILPNHKNPSYKSSTQTLEWIIEFAEKHK